VGFGDITPVSTAARMVVTGQMLLNLLVIGLVVRVVLVAAKRGVARRSATSTPE
jgi:voltage-gated potassium channel